GAGGGGGRSTIVEMMRSSRQADVDSIFGFSLEDETIAWEAAAGFRSPDIDYEQTVRRPLAIGKVLQALAENRLMVLEGAGSTSNFPLYVAEGVEYLAVAPLRVSRDKAGAVAAALRAPHARTDDE